jgi:hypothetical protein
MAEHFDFVVSREELECVRRVVAGHASLSSLLSIAYPSAGATVTVRLRREDAEQLRDRLTMVLAEVGFDENYLPNQRGQVLETLIDKFYVP